MAGSDDLATLFAAEPAAVLRGGQGQLLQFSPDTFENQVLFRGTVMPNVPVSPGVDALSLSVGDVVLLLGFSSTDGGASSWWIIGGARVPPLADPVQISGGQLRVVREDGPGIVVEGGGSIDVNDGGTIRARYEDGATGIFFGTLSLQGTDEPSGHGLLVQDDNAGSNQDIFRAQRELNGDKNVLIGSSTAGVPNPVDLFDVKCERIQIDAIGTSPAGTMTVDAENAIFLDGNDGVVLEPLNGGLFFTTPSTTSDPANLNIATTGLIREVTSSRRFKVDIEDYHVDPGTVLDLKPRTWRDRAEVERDPETDRWHVGFIAEEVDQLGLTGFVGYDRDERPKSIAYDRLTVALLEVVKDQDRRLAAIEERLSRLDKQAVPIDAVETTVKPKRNPSLIPPIEQPSREVRDA